MRKLIKQRKVVDDTWRYATEDANASAIIVSLEQFNAERDALLSSGKQIGVKLGPADKIEVLADVAPKLALVALEFTAFGEGRGYSQAHILRRRLGFTGELRAIGKVQRDHLFIMARCGFDAFELAEGADLDVALTAFDDYTVAYQPGVDEGGVQLKQRAG
ncbi:MAG: DUF934 domain-containing protein [Steroidobacteraceae bacterium]